MSEGKKDNEPGTVKPEAGQLNPGDDAAPGTPGTGEDVCPKCQGSGRGDNSDCPNCGGTGVVIKGVAGG
jgi:DnaJ-class molecular chaperone